eukprot:12221975-Heterocapsa_arctica.AAC.1
MSGPAPASELVVNASVPKAATFNPEAPTHRPHAPHDHATRIERRRRQGPFPRIETARFRPGRPGEPFFT